MSESTGLTAPEISRAWEGKTLLRVEGLTIGDDWQRYILVFTDGTKYRVGHTRTSLHVEEIDTERLLLPELIAELQKLQAEHGDLPVMVYLPREGVLMNVAGANKDIHRYRQYYENCSSPLPLDEYIVALKISK